MGIAVRNFRELVVVPTLKFRDIRGYNMWSPSAEELLMLTWAHESKGGKYLRQGYRLLDDGRGVALGVMMVEPDTFYWLQGKFPEHLQGHTASDLITDLKLSVVVARLRYYVDKEPLPAEGDIEGLAKYWRRVYNGSTRADVTWEEAARDYREIVLHEND